MVPKVLTSLFHKKKRIILLIYLFFLPLYFASAQAKIIQNCTHHFNSPDGGLIKSDRTYGTDIGESKYSTGTYICNANLDVQDILEHGYLYIGEVGDASYFNLISTPRGKTGNFIPITHGLSSLKDSTPKYMRFMPFFINLRNIFTEKGVYVFSITYKDIIPVQTGIRSGKISIEDQFGLITRFIKNSPGLTFHIIQIIWFSLLGWFILFWKGIHKKSKLKILFALVSTTLLLICTTGIPRYFSAQYAIRINDNIGLVTPFFLFFPIYSYIYNPNSRLIYLLKYFPLLVSVLTSLILSQITLESEIYFPIYVTALAINFGLIPISIALSFRKNLTIPTLPNFSHAYIPAIFLSMGIMGLWDMYNLYFLNYKYYLLLHYLYWHPLFYLYFDCELRIKNEESIFRVNLKEINTMVYKSLANESDGRKNTFDTLAHLIAALLKCNRVSISEIIDEHLKFLGVYGEFIEPKDFQSIDKNSIITECLNKREVILKSGIYKETKQTIHSKKGETHILLIPMLHNGEVKGVISLTNFLHTYISPFFFDRISEFQSEFQIHFNAILSERNSRVQANLLQITRIKTHPLEIKSEKFYMDHFNLDERSEYRLFIIGDLVDSTKLNSKHGTSVAKAIDAQLELLFDRHKKSGLILSRSSGDFISITFPKKSSDKTIAHTINRALETLKSLAYPDEEMEAIPIQLGIYSEFKYRFCLAVTKPQDDLYHSHAQAFTKFTLLSDSGIDLASRVIKDIALPGECIITEAIYDLLLDPIQLIELPPQRAKGIDKSIRLFKLPKTTKTNAA